MPFMLLILGVLLVVTVIAFLNTSPRVANRRPLLVFNAVTLALAVPVAIAVGAWIYVDAAAMKPDGKGMAAYLGVMAGGAGALLAVCVSGLVRNFLVFPLSRRLPKPPAGTP